MHLILEEAPAPAPNSEEPKEQGPWPFVLSAEDAASLDTLVAQLADYVDAHPGLSLSALSRTLKFGRDRLAHGARFTAGSERELVEQMRAWTAEQSTDSASQPMEVVNDRDVGPLLVLPGYPFARTRHWVGTASSGVDEGWRRRATADGS